MAFDEAGARAAGYSDQEIADFKARLAAKNMQTLQANANLAAPGDPNDPTATSGLDFANTVSGALPKWLGSKEQLAGDVRPIAQGFEGLGRSIKHTPAVLANILGMLPNQDLKEEARIDAPLMATTGGQVGNAIGEGIETAPLGATAVKVASKIPGLGALVSRSPVLQGSIAGGTLGATTSDPGERGMNTVTNAAAGGAIPLVGKGVERIINGLKRTPSADLLLNHGVDLTAGLLNPESLQNSIEDQAEHIPGGEALMHPPRESARQQWQKAAIEQAAVPGTKIKAGPLPEMLQQAQDSYGPLYDQAKGFPMKAQNINTYQPLRDAFAKFDKSGKLISGAANLAGAPDSTKLETADWLHDRFKQMVEQAKVSGSGLMSEHMLQMRSDVRAQARAAGFGTDPASRSERQIYKRADDAITQTLESQLPKDAMDAMKFADAHYGKYKVMEDAVASSKDQLAGLTPAKLSQAIYNATADPAYAKNVMGNLGGLRDFAQAGHEVFQKAPLTGMRAVMAAPLAYVGMSHPALGVLGAAGSVAGAATKTGRALAQGATKPQRLAQALSRMASGAADRTLSPDVQQGAKAVTRQIGGALAAPHIPSLVRAAGAVALRPDKTGVPQPPQLEKDKL